MAYEIRMENVKMAEKKKQAKKTAGAKKTAASAKKGNATEALKKRQRNRNLINALAPWVMGIVAVYLVVCYVVKYAASDHMELVGFVGKEVVNITLGLFGIGGFLIPVYLLNIAFSYKEAIESNTLGSKVTFNVLNLLFVSMLTHLLTAGRMTESLGELFEGSTIKDIYSFGSSLQSGGAVGGTLCEMLGMLLGSVGAMIVCVVFTFVTLVFLFGITPADVFRWIYDRYKENSAIREEEKRLRLEEYEKRKKEEEKQKAEKKKEAEKLPPREKKFVLPTTPDEDESETDETSVPDEYEEAETVVLEDTLKKEDSDELKTIPELAQSGDKLPWENTESEQTVNIVEATEIGEPEIAPTTTLEPINKGAELSEPADDLPWDEETEAQQAQVETEEVAPEPKYIFPPISLLVEGDENMVGMTPSQLRETSEKLVKVLESFNVKTTIVDTCCGPAVTRYELQPEKGVKIKSISNLSDDIALHLAARSVRIECPIPGKSAVGIELPNETISIVRLRNLLETKAFRDAKSKLFTCLGMDVAGTPIYLDIAKMPHLLIAGATGMGKSVCINSIVVSLLYKASPDEVKLLMIDPKKVELNVYSGIPHLLVPVVTDPKKAAGALNWSVTEMERRFSLIQEVGAHDLLEYNEMTEGDPEKEHLPQIVIFIDELADLMMTAKDDVETSICRLCQKARAAGMHLVIGTQRPSVDVVTGLIKSNIPSRIAFTVASQVDSRTIIDAAGAEKLMGRGDMLYAPVGMMKPIRVQGSFVETKEVTAVCEYIKKTAATGYNMDIIESIEKEARLCGEKPSKRAMLESEGGGGDELLSDEMIIPAIQVAIDEQTVSTSLLQRKLKLGYSRAAKIIDILEQRGYVSKFEPSIKGRRINITQNELEELKMKLLEEEVDE